MCVSPVCLGDPPLPPEKELLEGGGVPWGPSRVPAAGMSVGARTHIRVHASARKPAASAGIEKAVMKAGSRTFVMGEESQQDNSD